MEQTYFIYWIIRIILALWVGSVQTKAREVKAGWAFIICLILGPLWGWVAIALTCKRRLRY